MEYVFDNVIITPDLRQVSVDGEDVHLEPMEFDVLLYLVEHCDRVIPKEELLDNIWGDRFVSESALTTRIKAIRRCLGDDGRTQRVIRTHHGRGYRLIADVGASDTRPIAPTEPCAQQVGAGLTARLPRRRCDIVGRSTELAELLDLATSEHGLVTLVGPGGVGKTTISIEAGHRLAPVFDNSVLFCELAGVEEARVLDAIVGSIDGVTGATASTVAGVIDRLGKAPAVLILDNCEHVIDAVADLCELLHDALQDLTIIATSREPLDVRFEAVVRLDGLGTDPGSDPGVELFVARAGNHIPGPMDIETRRTIVEIVQRLDGLPLAIELAAARLRTMAPTELLAALENQMTLLRARRNRVERHTTMFDTIDWSYQLLDETERQTLVELSIFMGAFSSEAAQAVTSTEWAVPVLHRLVDQSVVVRVRVGDTSRYRLLEPIRQYVQHVLDQHGDDMIETGRQRHAEFFAARAIAIANGLTGIDEASFAAELSRDWADLAAATGWARANDRVDLAVDPIVALNFHLLWQLRIEAYTWLELAVETFGPEVAEREDVAVVRAMGAWTARDLTRAESLLEPVASLETPSVLFAQFNQLMARSAFEELPAHIDRFTIAAAQHNDPMWTIIATATGLIGAAMSAPDDPRTAGAFAAATELLRETTWPTGRCWLGLADLTLAVRCSDAARIQTARLCLERESAAAQVPWFAMTAGGLASGEHEAATPMARLELAIDSMQTSLDAGDLIQMPNFLRVLVVGLTDIGDATAAAKILGLIPTIHGLGETGEFAPGFADAAAWVEAQFDAAAFELLLAAGRRLDLAEAALLGREVLLHHSTPSMSC